MSWRRNKLGIRGVFQYFSNDAKITDRSIFVQIVVIKTPLLIVGVTKTDLKHCVKMPDAKMS